MTVEKIPCDATNTYLLLHHFNFILTSAFTFFLIFLCYLLYYLCFFTYPFLLLHSPKTVDPMTFCIAFNWNELSDMRQPYLSWLLMISYYFIEHFEEWYDI